MKDAIKNETKTYFKIPAWIILLLLVCLFIYCVVDNLNLLKCEQKDEDTVLIMYVCQLKYYSTIAYLIMGTFWNYMVAIIIMMITKTNTKLIRMLLTNIELDNLNITRVSDTLIEKSREAREDDEDSNDYELESEISTPDLFEDVDNEADIVTKANRIRNR